MSVEQKRKLKAETTEKERNHTRFVNKLAHPRHTLERARDKSRTVKQRRLIGQQLGHVITRGTAHSVVSRRDADPTLCTVALAGGAGP